MFLRRHTYTTHQSYLIDIAIVGLHISLQSSLQHLPKPRTIYAANLLAYKMGKSTDKSRLPEQP